MRKRTIFFLGLLTLTILALFPWLWVTFLRLAYAQAIYPLTEAPESRVAIVFGAQVYGNGRLSSMLRDRVETAVQLYHAGKVDKLLLSGDNSEINYNEPQAMMAYALSRGVPAEDIQPDYGGRRTYDTCYRAREIFGLDTAVLVTQEFHLPRALFTCHALGLDVTGVVADRRIYSRRSIRWSTTREGPAAVVALIDVIREQPAPVLGDPIPVH